MGDMRKMGKPREMGERPKKTIKGIALPPYPIAQKILRIQIKSDFYCLIIILEY